MIVYGFGWPFLLVIMAGLLAVQVLAGLVRSGR